MKEPVLKPYLVAKKFSKNGEGTAADVAGASGDGFAVDRSCNSCARERSEIAAISATARAVASSACETRAR